MKNNIKDHLNKIISIKWTETDFGLSKMKADYKRQLSHILQLDSLNKIHHEGQEIFISNSEVMYISDRNGEEISFISARLKKLKEQEKWKIQFDKTFPEFGKLVVDYLLGRYVFYNDRLYDVNHIQAKLIDNLTLSSLYGFKKGADYVLDILRGIDKYCHVEPVRQLEPYQMAGKDFVIDLKTNTLTRKVVSNHISYFKYYPVDFETAQNSKAIANKFLSYVIEDPDSLHNAQLQAYYIAQVASGLRSKTNFFVTKSGIRTGKGLRHIALSGLFNRIDVELDSLTSKGFEASNGWAMFSGGEIALATEQGDIVGDKVERVLKIIATEKTHTGRIVGNNQELVYLTSVLCIDTNRNVSLSDEMNGRKILIQYKDRPSTEGDLEREEAFEEYWKAFTEQDKSPRIEGCIGFLLASLDYFNKQGNKFAWKDVEVYNGNEALDDFQIYIINSLSNNDFVAKTGDFYVMQLYKEAYGNNNNKAGKALQTIGVKRERRKIGGMQISGYCIGNHKRFNTFIPKDEEHKKELKIDYSAFDNFGQEVH